ncbi:MAG TPA: DUF6455 family protein [Burkholderiales bacterium]|jgi:hypothetical protein|nr:DUF6455 family protein [Burkholderiales bacterium]
MIRRLLRAWRQARREIEKLELWQVLHRRGTRRLASHNPQALAFAVERCTGCRQAPQCGQEIAAGSDRAIETFCPNTMYLRHLDAMRRHAVTAKR